MTEELKRKIGQMICAGFPSPCIDAQARALMEKYHVGNFFIFARNYENIDQICALTGELHRLAYERFGVSPLIFIDQEGGAVSRITQGAAMFPGAMAQGAAGGRYAYACARNCGEILRKIGVTTTASPVLDVNVRMKNPVSGSRVFADEPEKVAEYGIAMMKGFQDGGVIATVKHYPGHGNVETDSHLALPINDTPLETLEKTEFVPFISAFEEGAELIMSAHVVYTQIDPEFPATLSEKIATGILREKQGFTGVAMTDCMEMNAIKEMYGMGEGAVRAVEAGMDLFTVSHTLEAVDEIVNALYRAVESGRLTEERIDRSYRRILALKKKYGLDKPVTVNAEAAACALFDEEAMRLHRQAALTSMTLLDGENGFADFRATENTLYVSPDSFALSNAEEDAKTPLSFAKEAARALGGECLRLPLNELSGEHESVLLNEKWDQYVIGLYNARLREGQKRALSILQKTGKSVYVVILGAPYDLSVVKNARAVMCAYEYTVLSVPNAIRAMVENRFPGVLPVTLR